LSGVFGGRLSFARNAAISLSPQALIASGRRIVVDLDIEKFFDRVNHDILMGLLAKRVAASAQPCLRSFADAAD
jgi:RNA-directed DNA polymerase